VRGGGGAEGAGGRRHAGPTHHLPATLVPLRGATGQQTPGSTAPGGPRTPRQYR